MSKQISDLVSRVTTLISFPQASMEINRLMADDNTTLSDIAKVIEIDPFLSASLLRVSNSAAMNTGVEIETVQKAISRLGLNQVRQLILAIEVARSFDALPNDFLPLEDFWDHCLSCAILSKNLANRLKLPNSDTAFTAGLLHDIGHLVLFNQLPEETKSIMEDSLDEAYSLSLYESEQKILGYDHSDVGFELARQWDLPDVLQACINAHHDLSKYSGEFPLPKIVHVANSLAVLMEVRSHDLDDAPVINADVIEEFSIDQEMIDELLEQSKADLDELKTIFVQKAA